MSTSHLRLLTSVASIVITLAIMIYRYSQTVPLQLDSRLIPCHALIDQCNARMLLRIIEALNGDTNNKRVLDVGTGSGQMVRLLLGLPGLHVEAVDADPSVRPYFKLDPELKQTLVHEAVLPYSHPPGHYDAVTCRGVLHHVPKTDRPAFLKCLLTLAPFAVLGDEAILEYADEAERAQNCTLWYNYVINEAHRRGLPDLARLEQGFLRHDLEGTDGSRSGMDFKESPAKIIVDAEAAGLPTPTIERLGDWRSNHGGFFVTTLRRS